MGSKRGVVWKAKELEFNLADHGKFLSKRQKVLDQSFRQIKKAVVYEILGQQGLEMVGERVVFEGPREQEARWQQPKK